MKASISITKCDTQHCETQHNAYAECVLMLTVVKKLILNLKTGNRLSCSPFAL